MLKIKHNIIRKEHNKPIRILKQLKHITSKVAKPTDISKIVSVSFHSRCQGKQKGQACWISTSLIFCSCRRSGAAREVAYFSLLNEIHKNAQQSQTYSQ